MITPADIANPRLQSGYAHVNSANAGGHKGPNNYWRASLGAGYPGKPKWRGPVRKDPALAAQDYCDHINGSGVTPVPQVKTAGHKRRPSRKVPAEVSHALGVIRDWRGQQKGNQGYVYCIAEAEGVSPLVKIGYSTDPESRPGELQTGNGRLLFLLGYFPGTEEDEKALHAKYIKDNTLQEWFRPSDELLSEFGFDTYDLYEKGSAARRG